MELKQSLRVGLVAGLVLAASLGCRSDSGSPSPKAVQSEKKPIRTRATAPTPVEPEERTLPAWGAAPAATEAHPDPSKGVLPPEHIVQVEATAQAAGIGCLQGVPLEGKGVRVTYTVAVENGHARIESAVWQEGDLAGISDAVRPCLDKAIASVEG